MGPFSRQRLVDLIGEGEGSFDLARAALLVACDEYASLDVELYLGRLDALARELSGRLAPSDAPRHQIEQINALLFHDYGFLGNTDSYYDPRNSYLNDVLDRRTGIPLTLSLVYVEVGRRAGLPLFGIGLPGHFIVGYQPEGGDRLLIDPFGQGRLLTEEACEQLVSGVLGQPVPLDAAAFAPSPPQQVLVRLVTNLKAAYVRNGDIPRAIRSSELLSLIGPTTSEVRERGLLRLQSGDLRGAARDLTDYLAGAPDAEDAPAIRRQLRWIDDLQVRRN